MNRYVTETEKAGLKRRMENYLERKAEKGLKRRQLLLSDAELDKIKAILSFWRGECPSQNWMFTPPLESKTDGKKH